MEDLITHAHVLFQSSNSSPPLPPAPMGDPIPALTYGSSHTKISEMPPPPVPIRPLSPNPRPKDLPSHPAPPPSAPSRVPQEPERAVTLAEDFTPQLPPRPTNSIHPSLRAGPMSSMPSRQSLPPPARNAQWFDESITFADVTPASPSVPPSPSRRLQRSAPSPLPLKSPWSESQPSLVSSANHSSTSVDQPNFTRPQTVNVISLNDDGPVSAPSDVSTFATAISPTPSSSSAGRQTPVTPPMSSRPLIPGSSPTATAISTPSTDRHHKSGSSSSVE